jgi:hypothetical protein
MQISRDEKTSFAKEHTMSDSGPTQGSNGIKMGMLSTARLARAFAAQAEDLRVAREKGKVLESQLDEIRQLKERQRELAELGEREMERLRREAESRLRAITLHTRDEERRSKLSACLAQRDLSPRQLVRWHEAISDEFRLIYPTRPVAEPSDRTRGAITRAESLAQFRFRG